MRPAIATEACAGARRREVGGHNRFVEMPMLSVSLKRGVDIAGAPPQRFAAVLHIESVALADVLVAAAVLVSSPLPGTS
jgi:putative copper resistance protein D